MERVQPARREEGQGAQILTSALLPEGFRDRLPPAADAASSVVRKMLDAAGAHGYERVQPPLAEYEDGLVGRLKSAPAIDLLRFVDPLSGRTLAIRPDITAQVGRIAATRMAHHPRPLRLSYAGPVVKLKAGQLRPEREAMQLGAELIGLDTVAAAREIVTVAIEALERAGVKGLTLDFTLPDLLDALGADDAATIAALLDAKDAGGLATAGGARWMPLIEAAGPFDNALRRLRAFDRDGALSSRLDALEAIAVPLAGRATLTLDPTERHGFEYQSWLGFSVFADGLPAEIGRGGSYAIVHEDGREEPAVGFSLYVDSLVDAALTASARRRLFLPLGYDVETAARLRGEGWVTVAALDDLDSAEAQICSHVLRESGPAPLG